MSDGFDAERIAEVAKGLSGPMLRWFERGTIRMGNPTVHVPRIHPPALDSTWKAVNRRGLIEHRRFGQQFTPLGLAVRQHLLDTGQGK